MRSVLRMRMLRFDNAWSDTACLNSSEVLPAAVTNEVAQIKQIFDDAEKMLDVGLAGPADATIDTLIADLERAGLAKVTEEMQAQVNEFLGQ